jgi:DNA-binding NtrC family response regulator
MIASSELLVFDSTSAQCPSGACNRLSDPLRTGLDRHPWRVQTVRTLSSARSGTAPDLLILRMAPAAPSLVSSVRARWAAVPIVVVLCPGATNSSRIGELLEDGANDYCRCPACEADLVPRVQRLLGERRSSPPAARSRLDRSSGLIGQNAAFLRAVDRIDRIAAADATTFIIGETGTGKELFARAIHYNSRRKGQPFIPVNCAAVPDHLFENEVFGHARGAYTDAGAPECGLLGVAEGGTLFLDEIDALSLSSQAKLLRFLQEKEYRPLGSPESRIANVRVIAATNSNLHTQIARGLFRADLYHRLNILTIEVPPLRDRLDDVPELARHFLRMYERQYEREPMTLSASAIHRLLSSAWPGNVRELQSVIHRAVVLATCGVIGPGQVDLPPAAGAPASGLSRDDPQRTYQQIQRTFLVNLLAEHDGNVSHAARAAGKDRRTVQRQMRKHGLSSTAQM